VIETYYSVKAYKELFISLNYQRIANPAYNAARGPVNIVGVRAHVSI
jgi:high affinity Mn2+ porin